MAPSKSSSNSKNSAALSLSQNPPKQNLLEPWLKDHRRRMQQIHLCFPKVPLHPNAVDIEKADAYYRSKPYIQAISDPMLQQFVIEVEKDLDYLEIPYGNISEIRISTRMRRAYGKCTRPKYPPAEKPDPVVLKRAYNTLPFLAEKISAGQPLTADEWKNKKILEEHARFPYIISIASFTLESNGQGLYETLLHEYLHSCYDCLDHGQIWQFFALLLRPLGVDLTRTITYENYGCTDVIDQKSKYILQCDQCGKKIYRHRMCRLVAHPEKFRCLCGGSLLLIRGKDSHY